MKYLKMLILFIIVNNALGQDKKEKNGLTLFHVEPKWAVLHGIGANFDYLRNGESMFRYGAHYGGWSSGVGAGISFFAEAHINRVQSFNNSYKGWNAGLYTGVTFIGLGFDYNQISDGVNRNKSISVRAGYGALHLLNINYEFHIFLKKEIQNVFNRSQLTLSLRLPFLFKADTYPMVEYYE